MKCIFCDEELDGTTKPEHVLLACLGGRKTTRRVDCSGHNEKFGETIDNEIGEQVKIIRNLLRLESGTGKDAPSLKNIKAGSETINFDGGGRPKLVAKPFTVTPRPDGNDDIQVIANSPEQLAAIIPHLAAYLRVTEDKVKEVIASDGALLISKRPGTVHHRLSFGGPLALRSAVKSALVLWALKVGNDEVKSDPYAAARQFVLEGGDAFATERIHLDSRYLPSVDDLKRRFGEFFNVIYVASNESGRVLAHFTLYNIISWQLVLAENGGLPGLKIGLISNPLNPMDWSDALAEDVQIDFNWLDSPDYSDEFKHAQERLARVMKHHFEQSRNEEYDRIIRDVLDQNGIPEGAIISDPTVINKIASDISHRVALHAVNLPHEKKLTPDDVKAYLNRGKS